MVLFETMMSMYTHYKSCFPTKLPPSDCSIEYVYLM